VEFPPVVSGWTEDPYPFSVVPDHRLKKTEIFDLFRDHYEGTGMDLTSGLAAGPFGDPYRDRGVMDEYEGGADDRIVPGAWAYPVSAITCGYSYICESSPDMADIAGGVVWFGFAQPYETCYMPVFAGVTNISPSYYEGNRSVVSRTYGYWPFSTVTNWARLRYDSMMPIIKEKQQIIERQEIQEVDMILQNATAAYSLQGKETAQALLTNYSAENTGQVITSWWELSEDLIVRFSNGMIWDPVNHSDTLAGYPDWWYNATGYQYGPRMYRTDLLDSIPGIPYSGKVISKSSEESPLDIRSDLLG
jgi:dipeptidase